MDCYIAPDNASMIKSFVEALQERPRGAEMLVAGIFTLTWHRQREQSGMRIFQSLWRRRIWRIFHHSSSRENTPGVGTSGHGAWSV